MLQKHPYQRTTWINAALPWRLSPSWRPALILGSAVLVLLSSLPVAAQSPEERGLEIAREADRRDQGFENFTMSMRMTLRNRHGQETVREMQGKTLEQASEGDKSIIVFQEPDDVKETALLTFSKRHGEDDQWVYLPALRRVKRIASNNKSGPFMGSEFAYEDLSSQEVEKYTYRFLREEDLGGEPMFVVERYPVDPKSGYSRQVTWIDQANYLTRKVEYYDRKEAHLKTLDLEDYGQYLERYWRPGRLEMVNHQTGKSTTLLLEDYDFQVGLVDQDFNSSSLSRAR